MNFKSYYNYDVYEDGRIWSNKSNIFLKQRLDKDGYQTVGLWIKNVKRKTYSVHRLMGELFLPNFNNLPEIDHIDRNKLNNSLFNLKWETYSNQSHNQKIYSTNTSGVKGVSYNKKNGKWIGSMMINKKRPTRQFKTKEEAILYRKELEVLSKLPYF